jgi:hypothetical protein
MATGAGTPIRWCGRRLHFPVLLAHATASRRHRATRPRVLELTHDTIHLEAGVRLVEVRVRRSDEGEFDPLSVQAAPATTSASPPVIAAATPSCSTGRGLAGCT